MKSKTHGFSRTHAKKWGVGEAIVLRYLADRVRKSNNVHQGKKWFYNPVTEILRQYPYLKRTGLDRILDRLRKKKLIEVGNFNLLGYDRTRWYSMSNQILDAVEEDPIWFDKDIAARMKVVAAVLLKNLQAKIKEKETEEGEIPYQRMSPNRLATVLPFSSKTIERGLKKLKDAGLIIQRTKGSAFYTLPHLIPAASLVDGSTSKVETTTSKVEKSTSRVDNDTYCKPLINPIGNSSKAPQAEPGVSQTTAEFLRSK